MSNLMNIRPGERDHNAFRMEELKRNPEQLARKFAEILKGWLTAEQQTAVIETNKGPDYVSGKLCATHDYCDPNQAMIDALEAFGIELDVQSDEQNALISDAWTIAKRNGFWFCFCGAEAVSPSLL